MFKKNIPILVDLEDYGVNDIKITKNMVNFSIKISLS